MSEFLQPVETAKKDLSQMTRYRALETMEAKKYNPVEELISIAKELKQANLRDIELEMKIHFKLLEYYSLAPKKQMSVDVQGQGPQIVIMPTQYTERYTEENSRPCSPKLIDVTPVKNGYEQLLGEADEYATHTNPEPR